MTHGLMTPATCKMSLIDHDRNGHPILETLVKFSYEGDYWAFNADQLRKMLAWIEANPAPLKRPLRGYDGGGREQEAIVALKLPPWAPCT